MGRPVYPYELDDPDFSWLISKYREEHPEMIYVESTCLPIVLIAEEEGVLVEGQDEVAPSDVIAANDTSPIVPPQKDS